MSFFYDLNKRLNGIRELPETTHQQLNESKPDFKDNTAPTKQAAKQKPDYKSKLQDKFGGSAKDLTRGLSIQSKKVDEAGMSRAAKGMEKYGKQGMQALAKAGREGKALDPVRAKFNKYDESMEEAMHSQDAMKLNPDLARVGRKPGIMGKLAQGVKKVANFVAPGDEDLVRDLERKTGGRRPTKEAAKPDFLDLDGDGDTTEPMKKAAADAKKKSPTKEAVKAIPGGRRHTAEPGGYGRRDDDEAPRVQTQRGRGRPKKGSDSETGEVMKPDFSAFGAGGKVNLPKHKGAVTRHKMVGEGGTPHEMFGKFIKQYFGQIYDYGDDGLEYLDNNAPNTPTWARLFNKHNGNIDSMIANESAKVLKQAALELKAVASDLPFELDESGVVEGNHGDVKAAIRMLKKAGYTVSKSDEQVTEKAVSKKQQRFMGMVSAAKKGEKPASKEVARVAKTMKKADADDFASTKHKGLPNKTKAKDTDKKPAKEEKVDETTTSGSVATAPADSSKKSSGGITFGGGIYDSMNHDLENMISESMSRLDESMNISMNMNSDAHGGPTKSITITATEEDADKLAAMLKMAGMGSGHDHGQAYTEAANTVDENQPDYPTDPEYSDDAFQYAGGLNKPKRDVAGDGQATGTVTAVRATQEEDEDLRRMMEVAGVKKKSVDEETTEEGNLFTGNLAKARAAGKKEADLDGDGKMEKVDESIFAATADLWKSYKA